MDAIVITLTKTADTEGQSTMRIETNLKTVPGVWKTICGLLAEAQHEALIQDVLSRQPAPKQDLVLPPMLLPFGA